MKIFGFELRRIDTDSPQTPDGESADPILTYTPEDRVIAAYADARLVLAHLLRGFTGSKRSLQRTGMSNRRWTRAVAMLTLAGVVAVPRSGESLELVVQDGRQASRLLRDTRRRLLRNLEQPNYRLPFR